MKAIGILLILTGILGFVLSTIAFGDIGLSFGYGGAVALLCGVGFLIASRRIGQASGGTGDGKKTQQTRI